MLGKRIGTVIIVSLFIATALMPIVPSVLGGQNSFKEEYDNSTYKNPASNVAGWNSGEISIPKVKPRLVGSYNTPSWGTDIAVQGEFAYIADESANMLVLNISSVSAPKLSGTFTQTGGWLYAIAVEGDLAIVGDWNFIRAVNITKPTSPTIYSSLALTCWPYEIKIVDDWAFVTGWGGSYAINISNPGAIGPAYSIPMSGSTGEDIDIAGDMAYIPDTGQVRVFNVSNPTSISQVTTINVANGMELSVDVEGEVLYIGSYTSAFPNPTVDYLYSYNIKNPKSPVLLGSLTIQGTTTSSIPYDLEADGDYMYLTNEYDGVHILNISNPASPKDTGGFYPTSSWAMKSLKVGTELFMMDGQNGLFILNVSFPVTPKAMSTYDSPGNARNVFVSGNFAYVADEGSGLRVVNITDPNNIKNEGTYDTTGNSFGVWVSDGYAYVADALSGLQIINVSNPAVPKLYGTYDSPVSARDVMVCHKWAYVADGTGGLQIVNVTKPNSPVRIGGYDSGGNSQGVWVSGDVAYIADGVDGLVAVNIQKPAAPVWLGFYDTDTEAVDVQVDGDIAYVADRGGGLVILNVSNPKSMTLIKVFATTSSAQGVFVHGNLVYVADDNDGLRIINVTNPWSPSELNKEASMTDAWGVYVTGNYSYVANVGGGLVSVRVYDSVANYFERKSYAESLTVDNTPYLIVAVNLTRNETKPTGTNIYYNVTNNGGSTWMSITPGVRKRFATYASDLRWRANLTSVLGLNTPKIQNVTLVYYYDDVRPVSSAANGAPPFDNEGTIPVQWTASDPWPDTGVKETRLWFRYDSNSDGDFTDLGDIAWSQALVPTLTGTSGTFYFNPEGNDGTYEFYTVATDNASLVESAPASADDSTIFDTVRPTSNCFGGSPTYANGGTITVWYNASDPSPGSGINNVSLYYRMDSNNDGDFTDVGDTDWGNSGATVQTATQGSFSFNPKGKDGRYEFFTLATDKATNAEKYPPVRQSFTIYDSHPPITTAYIGGTATASGWYVGSVYIFLNAEDAISGVNKTKFRVDGGQWNAYMQPILINSDGKHTVDYYSEDRAGNKETNLQVKINVDNSAPETDFTLSGTLGNNGWYTSEVIVTFTAKDDFSGMNKTKYRVNSGGWKTYTGPVKLSDDGAFAINYYSVDNASNDEERGDLEVFVDRTPPAITHTLVGNPAANGAFPAPVTVIITASDPTSGLASIEYKLDNGNWSPYSEALVISDEGNHTLRYRATDIAGNRATSAVTNIVLDLTPPTVTIALTGLQHSGWYNSTATVTVTASDGENAVGQVQVSLDRGPWMNYTAAIKISDPGAHTVEARAVDLVGHESEVASASFKVDVKAPVTAKTVAGTLGKNGWYISDVQVILTPGDDLSGVASTVYRINAGAWTTYTEPVAMSIDGTYNFEYRATDLAGNTETVKNVTIKVDKTPPTITFTSHKDGQKVNMASVTLIGKTDPKATLKINDVAVTLSADGIFTKAVTLVEGENTIKAVAEDPAGHVTTVGISLVRDTTPPTVLIYTPLNGLRTTDTSVIIQGSTEPGANVTVNGEPVTVDSNGGFSKLVNLDIGTKTLTVKVTDPIGNTVEQTRSVTRDKPKKETHEATANEVLPLFLLGLVLVAVLVALLGYFMGRRSSPPRKDFEEEQPAPGQEPAQPEVQAPRPRKIVRGNEAAQPTASPTNEEEKTTSLRALADETAFKATENQWENAPK
jgi:hypothetical protein